MLISPPTTLLNDYLELASPLAETIICVSGSNVVSSVTVRVRPLQSRAQLPPGAAGVARYE